MLKTWQKRLQLLDWELDVNWAKQSELDAEDDQANVQMLPESQRAHILILAPRYRGEGSDSPEEDLIHELLHLVLEGHGPRARRDTMFERGLNQLSKALWQAYNAS